MNKIALIYTPALCGMLALAGCGGRQAAGPRQPMRACLVLPRPETPAETLRVVLPGSVDPLDAPVPRNESERILFGHLYETLIVIDCEGRIRPCLASRWRGGEGGSRWTFELRSGARFWDGDPVTAADIVDCWQSRTVEPFVWDAGVDSVAAAGERAVHVYLSDPAEEVPRVLSAPPFAVARKKSWDPWPAGTSAFRIEPWRPHPGRGITLSPVSGADGPVLVFIDPGPPGSFDTRDLLEGRADLIITRDADVIEYASARPHLEIVPLPWSRTYALLSTARAQAVRLGETPAGIGLPFRDDLARDAVPVISRGHTEEGWWESLYECRGVPAGYRPGGGYPFRATMPEPDRPGRILFDEDDPAARGLAERIVALSGGGRPGVSSAGALAAAVPGITGYRGGISAAGVPEEELRRSLEKGDEFAYVIWLPLRPPDPCAGARDLAERAVWLSRLGADLGEVILPLVDTRAYAVIRRGAAGLSADWYGNISVDVSPAEAEGPPGGR